MALAPHAQRLTLGPVLFNWTPERKRDFYFRIADEAPVDVVYLGEVVCAKRAPFLKPLLPEIAERLARAGKTVVWSAPILIETPRELAEARALAASEDLMVEANDIGAAALLAGRAHCIGPTVNVYNERTLHFLARRGAVRFTLPWELPGASIAQLCRAAVAAGAATEVGVFGRVPLAISARCYHARVRGLTKDSCRYVCGDDPDGLAVRTLDDQPFLAVNGTQTLSFAYLNLVAELPALAKIGVSHLRLSPQAVDMVGVVATFRRAADAQIGPAEAAADLARLVPHARFANGFFHDTAGAAMVHG